MPNRSGRGKKICLNLRDTRSKIKWSGDLFFSFFLFHARFQQNYLLFSIKLTYEYWLYIILCTNVSYIIINWIGLYFFCNKFSFRIPFAMNEWYKWSYLRISSVENLSYGYYPSKKKTLIFLWNVFRSRAPTLVGNIFNVHHTVWCGDCSDLFSIE